MQSATAANPSRLYFLDWVRIIAFFVLIAYHVGMYYVTWGWHVKSPFASAALEPLMMLSSPWRLGLLFLVSGVASSFMLARISAAAFMRQRSSRLLIPLLFGMLVVVPPQSYFEVVEKLSYPGSFVDFMKLYLNAYHGFCEASSCLILPTWNHLWFVAYLWVYTLVLGALVLVLGARFDTLSQRLASLLRGWRIIVLPLAVLALARVTLAARFPSTHALLGDWHNHANYFFLFLLGAMLARQRLFWSRPDAMRWLSLGIALACWAALTIFNALIDENALSRPSAWFPWIRMVYSLCQWSAILAACGFAHRHLQFDSPQRRYLTQAVFPVYILHQSLIVSIAHLIKPAHLAPGLEGPVLIVLTLSISLGVFELVRRCPPLQPLFGIAKARRPVLEDKVEPGPLVPA